MVGRVVIKRKYVTLMRIMALGIIFYGIFKIFTRQSDNDAKHDHIERFSDYKEDIKNDIALEIKNIFRPNFELFKADVEKLKNGNGLVPNPDKRYHTIKKNTPMLLESSSLNISKLALLLETFNPVEPPTANASLFVQDLPQRWPIAGYLLRPKKVEELSEKHPFPLHQCFKLSETRQQWKMITLIKSQVVNVDIRNAIRETWGSVEKLDGIVMHVVFLLARASSLFQQYTLNVEDHKHGDILQVNLPESTTYLTGRTISGMKWVSRHFPSDCILSVIDENMFMSLQKVIKAVSNFVDKSPSIENGNCKAENVFPFLCGYNLREIDQPLRNSKSPWFVSEDHYPPRVFPPHCQGSFYITSVSTINLILDVATKTYAIQVDSIWITGILRQKLGLGKNSIQDLSASMKFAFLARFLKNDIAKSIRDIWKVVSPKFDQKNVVFKKKLIDVAPVIRIPPIRFSNIGLPHLT